MFPVVHPGKVQEFLHIVTDIFPLFPYDSDFYADGWTEGNSFYAKSGKFISLVHEWLWRNNLEEENERKADVENIKIK